MSDYYYEYEYDNRYCYPDSFVLINKLNITDASVLEDAEREITALRTALLLDNHLPGNFDAQHLKAMHKELFGDLYKWAGETRLVNISKGSEFCRYEHIDEQLDTLFDKLKAENYLQDSSTLTSLAKRLAHYLGEINAIHPFREGNGRVQRMFVEHLAYAVGYDLNYAKIASSDMLEASVRSFNRDYALLENLIENALNKHE